MRLDKAHRNYKITCRGMDHNGFLSSHSLHGPLYRRVNYLSWSEYQFSKVYARLKIIST